jgi:RNA polymerase sigma-70 factor (ECF subfamily)
MSMHLDPATLMATFAAARTGSNDALGHLLQSHWDYLYSIASKLLPQTIQSRVGADDLVQHALSKAFCSFDTFRGETAEQCRDWLDSILRHKVNDAIRRATQPKRDVANELPWNGNCSGPDPLEELAAAAETPLEMLTRQEELADLRRAVAALPALLREVVWLRVVEELSHAEIAWRLGRTPNAVMLLYRRAVGMLRQRMIAVAMAG